MVAATEKAYVMTVESLFIRVVTDQDLLWPCAPKTLMPSELPDCLRSGDIYSNCQP